MPVKLAVMKAANRHRELVAHLASQCSRLREAEMVGIRGLAAAHDAGLLGHELEVILVAQPNGLASRVEVAPIGWLCGGP